MIISPPYIYGYPDPGSDFNNGDPGAIFFPDHYSVANTSTGEFVTHNSNNIYTSGEQSRQVVTSATYMQFYFQSDFTGAARVVANLLCRNAYVTGDLDDLSGVSSAHIRQRSNLYITRPGVIDGNTARYSLVEVDVDDHGGPPWGPYLVADPGQVVQYEYTPNSTFTAGEWILLQIAIEDYQYAGVNDMGSYDVIHNDWIITHLDVEKQPEPT